ncbi:MAG: M23 family metallopeptidase [Calditrichaeota bacterium]|nr:M23 family metallopeptidase [Calditrichota bacterium]
MSRFRFCVFFLIFIFLPNLSSAQNYLWPTDASHYLTSSFAEYRPGHFHAGIDIKTWGKEGYKVFAVRDGYIWQIRVSPYGYGKVIYQKLDTGEIALYAHLSRFNDELQRLAKREQKRRGEYRISKYLNASQFPVKKGDIIGYTGSTGIGYPHLHFELRDRQNRPINPFTRGYRVKDRVRPHAAAIGFIPLESRARINGDAVPLILPLRQNDSGQIEINNPLILSGKIGLAIQCWDQANDVPNKFSAYRLRLYVDGDLKFAARYSRFSYAETHFIDFDRNYRLRKRGIGLFQNLFKNKHNPMKFYQPPGQEIGVLQCRPNAVDTTRRAGILPRGKHSFTVEISDFWGNTTVISGNFIVEYKKTLSAHFMLAKDTLTVQKLQDQFGTPVADPEAWIFSKDFPNWHKAEIGSNRANPDDGGEFVPFVLYPVTQKSLIKISAVDSFGVNSFPLFYVPGWKFDFRPSSVLVHLEKDFYDDYIRFDLTAKNGIMHTPQMIIYQQGNSRERIPLVQKELNEFIGVYQMKTSLSGELTVDVSGYDQNMAPVTYQERFSLQPILPDRGGEVVSNDEKCRLVFQKNDVYDPLFLRMSQRDSVPESSELLLSKLYEFYPQDVLLKGSAHLTLNYPVNDSLPGKLAIYGFYGKSWGFVDNKIDTVATTISANIGGLGAFALLRDTVSPEVYIYPPRLVAGSGSKIYTFRAKITDKLSGIANERSIRMLIDNKKVIAEYDPEKKTIVYQNEKPFSAGRHEVKVRAIDRSGNLTTRRKSFIVK